MVKIAAGIVLYNPELNRLQENIMHVISQVSFLVLVDNGSENIGEIEELYGEDSQIYIIKNRENLGVAAALNIIIKFCEQNGYDWILTLDQDSVCSGNLLAEYIKYMNIDKAALLTPRVIDKNEIFNDSERNKYDIIERCITSASLVNVAICRSIGYFDERMFIDYVDFDYCIRLVHAGYKIIRVNTTSISHELGHAKQIRIFFTLGEILRIKKIQKFYYTYNHSSIRTYYYARNSIYYIRKHKEYINVKSEAMVFIKWITLKLIFENKKLEKLKATFKGIKDGIRMPISEVK